MMPNLVFVVGFWLGVMTTLGILWLIEKRNIRPTLKGEKDVRKS